MEVEESQQYKLFMSNFTKEEKLGEGTYGVVTRTFDKKRAKNVALKKIKLENQDDEGIPSTTIREIAILFKLQHKNIVTLHEVKYFLQEQKMFLVFESLQCDLKRHLDTKALTNFQIKSIIFQILQGINYCHSKRVLHRDLKPQNILIQDTTVKIADFGLSRVFSFPMPKFTKEIATLWYRAPELMLGDDHYGTGIDIWSIGCIMAECLSGKVLFVGDSQIDMLFKMMNLLGTPTDDKYVGLTKLSSFSLNFPKFPGKPITSVIHELQNDIKGQELLCSMLQFNPAKRPQAKELLQHSWFDDIRHLY